MDSMNTSVSRWIHRQTDSRQISLQIRVTSKQIGHSFTIKAIKCPNLFFFGTLDAVWLSTRGGEIRVRQEAPSANGQPPEPVLQAPKSPAWLSDDSEPGSKIYNVNVNYYLKLLTKHYDMLVIDQAHHGIAYKLDTMHHYAGVHGSCLASGGLFGPCPCLLTHLHVRTTLPKQLALHLCSSSLIHGCAWCSNLST